MSAEALLQIEHVHRVFSVDTGWFSRRRIDAVQDVSLDIRRGEMLALVGESGSGKSTLGRMCVRLVDPSGGRILFDGNDVARARGAKLRWFRRQAQIVFQNPYLSLNPRMRIGDALSEVYRVWRLVPRARVSSAVEDLLVSVQLPTDYTQKYPHELSGGERQRIAIARAIALEPAFLVADEPVSALDVSASARILNLLLDLKERLGFTCLFITHDLNLARVIADRVAVMNKGRIVEVGAPGAVFFAPQDAYTKALVDAQLVIPTAPNAAGGEISLGRTEWSSHPVARTS